MQQINPMLQAKIEQQKLKQANNDYVTQPKVDIGEAKLEQLDKDIVSLSSNNSGEFDYSKDDGKISFSDKLKNFGKGLISPITNIFSSPKNFLIGAGIMAAGAALTVATGGAIAPLFVALGVTGGAIQLGTSFVKAHNAKTDDEARAAYQGIGAGTSAVGMSVLGSKAALKGAGVDTKSMSFLKSTIECFKQVPNSISKSVGAFTSGQALTNIKNVFKPKKSANTETNSKPKAESKTETQAENNTEVKPDTKTEPKSEPKADPKPDTKPEPKTEPKSDIKPENSSEVKPDTKSEPKAEPKTETQTEQPHVTEPKADKTNITTADVIDTISKEEANAKAKFVAEMKDKIPSYEERYNAAKQEIELVRPEIDSVEWAKNVADETNYLDNLWKKSNDGRMFSAKKMIAKLDQEQLSKFNKAKDILKQNGIEFEDYELFEKGELWGKGIGTGIENQSLCKNGSVYGHGQANAYNYLLREEGATGNEGGLWQKILDKGLENVPGIEKETTVYRGIQADSSSDADFQFVKSIIDSKKGSVISDKGYSYASYKSGIANGYAQGDVNAKLVIKVPKGAKVSRLINLQSEMLFPRNAEFKVLTPYNPKTGEIFVEYVLPNN